MCVVLLALLLPQPGQARGGTQFLGFGFVLPGNRYSLLETFFDVFFAVELGTLNLETLEYQLTLRSCMRWLWKKAGLRQPLSLIRR